MIQAGGEQTPLVGIDQTRQHASTGVSRSQHSRPTKQTGKCRDDRFLRRLGYRHASQQQSGRANEAGPRSRSGRARQVDLREDWMPAVRTRPTISATAQCAFEAPSHVTTTHEAKIRASMPMPSTAACAGTTRRAAHPAMKQRWEACTYTADIDPALRQWRSCEVARRMTPNWLR